MDVNFSAKKIQYVLNDSDKLPDTKQEDTSMQTNQCTTPKITPDSAILRAYTGIIEPKKIVSKEEIVNYLKNNGVLNENLYETVIKTLTEKDGTISLFALNTLKQLLQKIHIQQAASILNNTKENGTFNKQAIQLADSLIPKERSPYGLKINISEILRNCKNKDGNFNPDALNLLFKHNEKLAPLLARRADLVFNALKNKDNEFCPEAIKYLNYNISDDPKSATLIKDLLTGKDGNGNFNINLLEFNNYLNETFAPYQIPAVKNVLSSFEQKQTKERDEFLEFAKSIKGEWGFNNIITFIKDHKSSEDLPYGLNFNKESAEFTKELINKTLNSPDLASMAYKNLRIPPQEYTEEIFTVLKRLCPLAGEDIEIFLNASKNKTGDKKGKLNLDTLKKYIHIAQSRQTWYGKVNEDALTLMSYLSLEENNKALDIVVKLDSIEFGKDKFLCKKIDKNLIDFALKILCNYDTQNNCPRQKCNTKALNAIKKLLNNNSECESIEDFTRHFKEIINDTVKEQYLNNKDTNIINVSINDNINSVLEIDSGKRENPTTFLYDFSKGKIISQTKEVKNDKIITQIQEDYINNTKTETSYEFIPTGAPISQSISKYDENGNLLYTQTIEKSPLENIYNVTKKYADGTEEKICNAYKPPEGNDIIEKHMTSLDGTKTDYRYEDDILGNRIIDYKITDKNGKILMNQSTTFEVIDENHFVSSRNNKKFDIKFNGTSLSVTNLQTNETVTIELDKFTKGTYEKLIPVLKSFPGDELFNMKKLNLDSMSVDESVDNACFNNHRKTIKTRESYIDLSVLLHELGHAKDDLAFNEINETINNDPQLRQIYEEERKAFRENFGDAQQSFVGYFCADTHYLGKDNSIDEGIAETNTLLSTYPKNNIQNIRSLYWQQYFPRTIAYLSGLLN